MINNVIIVIIINIIIDINVTVCPYDNELQNDDWVTVEKYIILSLSLQKIRPLVYKEYTKMQ